MIRPLHLTPSFRLPSGLLIAFLGVPATITPRLEELATVMPSHIVSTNACGPYLRPLRMLIALAVGGVNGVGSGTCYVKDNAPLSFTPADPTHVAVVRLADYDGFPPTSTIYPTGASSSSQSTSRSSISSVSLYTGASTVTETLTTTTAGKLGHRRSLCRKHETLADL